MLFRQICGRALRMHQLEDGTAALIHTPAFPRRLEFAANLYNEADEIIRDRRCHNYFVSWHAIELSSLKLSPTKSSSKSPATAASGTATGITLSMSASAGTAFAYAGTYCRYE